jgi:hypothetical protein
MSFIVTEGSITNAQTGIPVPTGNIITTESGVILCTTPIGEAPGGLNTTPGITNLVTGNNIGWNQLPPGVPYGFSAPVFIGPLTPP